MSEGIEVDLQRATKRYGAKVALDEVDLRVLPGTLCVLLGPSGSGKTTLLRCLAGIERLSSGQLRLGGRLVADGASHEPPERRDLSMVFQDYALWPHLTAARNVAFALGRRRLGRGDSTARARQMLERVGLGHLAERYPNELSGGEQQRVALARALVAETGLLLFDEPLSNLDADLRERMRLEIATLTRASGATSVYITHDQAEAFALADTVGVLRDGRLVQLGPPEEIYLRPATPFVARFTGLAGEVPVRVAGGATGDDLVPVEPLAGGSTLLATAMSAPEPGTATLLVRPAGVQLLAADHARRHLDGVVVDAAYRGRGYDHAVRIGRDSLVGIHDQRRWARGDRVGVRLDPSSCLLFPSETPAAEPVLAPAGA